MFNFQSGSFSSNSENLNITQISNGSGSRVCVNGHCYEGKNSVVVSNGRVIIDGVEVGSDKFAQEKTLNIIVDIKGDVGNLQTTSGKINIQGNVTESVRSATGHIQVTGNVGGSVTSSSGSVTIGGDVTGNSGSTSGSVQISGNVGGNVETVSGNVSGKSIRGTVKTLSGRIW
jgi:hypothetical protein